MMEMPVLRPRDDGRWELAEPFGGVPAGFVTDGGSIPRFFWRICGHPMQAPQVRAYVRHDWEYAVARKPRKVCDDQLLADLKDCGVGLVNRTTQYFAVRAFGARHYGKEG